MKELFTLIQKDEQTKARLGKIVTARNEIETPVFMPVGTQGTVKGISNDELELCGAQMIITNAYHLYLRPGMEVINKFNGIHKFTGWNRSITTDSGGYQLYSLTELRKISEAGVEFQSHVDGSMHFFSPEKVIQIQSQIGSDIMMSFDECPPYPSSYEYTKKSLELTAAWAKKGKTEFEKIINERGFKNQFLFGIVQGGTYHDLRKISLEKTTALDFDGYSLGGLAVGEPKEIMYELIDNHIQSLPGNKVRYAMGIGQPEDIWHCAEHGVDMFDCVIPTRNGRNGQALTSSGKVNIKNSENRNSDSPLDDDCSCPVCKTYPKAYLHHLYHAGEILGLRLLTLHNIFFIINLTKIIRESIKNNDFLRQKEIFLNKYNNIK